MADTFYVTMYAGFVAADERGGTEMRFDHYAKSFINGLYCRDAAGNDTGLQAKFELLERHGVMGMWRATMPDNWSSNWKTHHTPGPASPIAVIESVVTPTQEAVAATAKALRTKAKAYINSLAVPASPTGMDEIDRIVGWLWNLDLTGHHPGFDVVRKSYVESLHDRTGMSMCHWMYRPPFVDESSTPGHFPVRADVVLAMDAEMQQHDMSAPCWTMQYGWLYGSLCHFLDLPVA